MKSTFAVAWRTQSSRGSSGYVAPVIPLTTCAVPRATGCSATSRRIAAPTPSINGEWKACETSSCVTWMPWADNCSDAARTPAVVPEITVWRGWLRFATTAPSMPAATCATEAWSAAALAIAPGSGSCRASIASPRCATSRTQSSSLSTPAAAAAANSPRLWPSVTSARTPISTSSACNARPTAAIAGWQTSVAARRFSASGPGCA